VGNQQQTVNHFISEISFHDSTSEKMIDTIVEQKHFFQSTNRTQLLTTTHPPPSIITALFISELSWCTSPDLCHNSVLIHPRQSRGKPTRRFDVAQVSVHEYLRVRGKGVFYAGDSVSEFQFGYGVCGERLNALSLGRQKGDPSNREPPHSIRNGNRTALLKRRSDRF
jgi:hypothetical protein